MKLLRKFLLLTVALAVPVPLAWAADAPIVRDVFTCSFNEGKDMGDLMAARDYYLRQMEKAGQEPSMAFVWTPIKAGAGFDFIWANNHENMLAYAEATDAFNNSADTVAAMERFETVASCTSNLAMRWQTYQAQGELALGDNGAVINAFACNYRRGHGSGDLEDVRDHIGRVLGSLDVADGAIGYASVPTVGAGPDSADVYFYGVNSSLTHWAKRTAALEASEGMPSLMRHLQTVMECNGALFYGLRMVPPLE